MMVKQDVKSLHIFEGSNGKTHVSFAARHGWFNCFSDRANLHNVNVSGQADSADTLAARQVYSGKEQLVTLAVQTKKNQCLFLRQPRIV
jgi:hypothetical protein